MKKIIFTILSVLFALNIMAQITTFPYVESFEAELFPPEGWLNFPVVAGDAVFERKTVGEWPNCMPVDGEAMASYNSFSASAGEEALLITPELILGEDNVFRFWFFRSEDPSNNRADRVEIYFNNTPDLEGAVLLDSVYRAINFYPEVPQEDWYQYSFMFNHPGSTYIIIKAISGYGWRMYLDKIEVETSTVDENPPEFVWLNGTQAYAYQQMDLSLRVSDQSEMPEELLGECTILDEVFDVTFERTNGTTGFVDYEATIQGYPNFTEGEMVILMEDVLGNEQFTDVIPLSWKFQQPFLEEDFEGEEFPPLGWVVQGQPLTWLTWDDYGLVYYTDSDEVEWLVYPVEGERQSAVEWDFQGNVQNEWMITPEVEITEEAVLVFKQFAKLGGVWYDQFEVKATIDNFTWDVIWDASDYPEGETDYEEDYAISLNDYVGETIRLAWNAYNTQGTNLWYSWFVDDIRVLPTDTLVNVNELSIVQEMQVFPNPCSEVVTITLPNTNDETVTITLFSQEGRVVKNRELDAIQLNNGSSYQLVTDDLPSGIYFLTVRGREIMSHCKLIIKQ